MGPLVDPDAESVDELAPGLFVGPPARNNGARNNAGGGSTLTATALGVWGLALVGVATPFVIQQGRRWHRSDALGGGLLLAGLVENAADRLTLGYVRDCLTCGLCPSEIFNLADVFMVLGALVLFGSWARQVGGRLAPLAP